LKKVGSAWCLLKVETLFDTPVLLAVGMSGL
jgi:hypothetical protein